MAESAVWGRLGMLGVYAGKDGGGFGEDVKEGAPEDGATGGAGGRGECIETGDCGSGAGTVGKSGVYILGGGGIEGGETGRVSSLSETLSTYGLRWGSPSGRKGGGGFVASDAGVPCCSRESNPAFAHAS